MKRDEEICRERYVERDEERCKEIWRNMYRER